MHKNHLDFITHVKRECRRYGIKLILSDKDRLIVDNQTYGGYFDTIELFVSNGAENWIISTLVHEFSHMEQWIENDPVFTHRLRGGYQSYDIMDKWLGGNTYKPITVKSAVGLSRDCELDCDRRAIKNITKYNLQLDIERYCQESNAYILMYNFAKKIRQWEFKNSPLDDRIVNHMPTDLTSINYNTLPREYELLYKTVLL